MSRFWSPIVKRLEPYTPGEQPKQQQFIKLNTNEHPYGPSPRALEAIRQAADERLKLYPEPASIELRSAIASQFHLSADYIFEGNGSDEVLGHAFHAFFTEKEPVAFPDITYGFYKSYCKLYGIKHQEIALDESLLVQPKAYTGPFGGVIIANPNAPTGQSLSLQDIEELLQAHSDVLVLVDEAYVDFGTQSAVALVPSYDNLLVVQTFSKSRGLAGLRVGFAVGQPHLIEALQLVKNSFNSYPLDCLAQAGAIAAWNDKEWFEHTCRLVIEEREKLAKDLMQLGFQVHTSATNFLLASHCSIHAEKIAEELRDHGILVRHFNKKRIENYLRISIGTAEECAKLVATLNVIVREKARS
ncbi:histidinol-phosphate transaminase [Flexibacterium corallicola]|uniref:histidinol-phosphate transaminase n=1 Tax=Flexibacterium corallicola TaxID=3037259 RepID=UPI00286F9F79|nr:histidinol-phosphate transaminase [Pseudovibrio sp. M1P-2-3]